MPAFTVPKDVPIKVTCQGQTSIETISDPVYISWDGNCNQRLGKEMKLKQPFKTGDFMPSQDLMDAMFYDESAPVYSLDTLTNSVPTPVPQCIPATWDKDACKKKIKEHNMSNNIYATAASVNSTVPTDQKQRDYTLGRLRDIKDQKYTDLRKQFGFVDDDAPVTFEDLMARIQAGKFIFPEDKKQKHYGIWSILDIIRWRDPSVKEDQDGFNKATEKLDEAYTTARDQTVLDVPTQGLKIIEEFKTLTIK